MAIEQPNYTQIPNQLLGNLLADDVIEPGIMAYLSGSEIFVFLAVCRLTFGFHREERRASITMIEQLTGLSRQSVITAARELESYGLIERGRLRSVTVWRVMTDDELVQKLDQTSLKIRPEESKNLTRGVKKLDQRSLKIRPPSKKEKKETTKEKIGGGGDDFTELSALFATEFGGLATRNVLAILRSDLDTYGLVKIREAVGVALANNKRTWSYVQGVLKRQASAEFPVQQELPEQPEITPIQHVWDICQSQLRMQMTQATWETQIKPCELSHTANGNYQITAPSAMVVEWLEGRLRGVIERTLAQVLDQQNLTVEFLVKTEEQS